MTTRPGEPTVCYGKITIFHGKIHYFYGQFQLLFVGSPEGIGFFHDDLDSTYPLVNMYTLCELEREDLESSLVFTHYSKSVVPSFFVKRFSIEAKPPFSQSQWIGLREKLQESPIFSGNIYGFRFQFSHDPILWQSFPRVFLWFFPFKLQFPRGFVQSQVLIHRSDRRSRCVSSGGETMSENAL